MYRYCEEVRQLGLKAGLRVEVDPGGRSLSKQIKIANKDKIPLYAVVGQKEVDGRTLAVQARKEEGGLTDLGTTDVLDVLNRIELSAKSGARLLDIWGLEDGE